MKKVLSLLVAFATAIGVSATAFAAEDDIIYIGEDVDYSGAATYNVNDTSRSTVYGASGIITLTKGEIVLVTDSTTPSIIARNAHLDPGNDYKFRLYRADADQTNVSVSNAQISPVTDSMLGGGKFRLRGRSGTASISSAKIVKRGTGDNATYRLDLTTRQSWGVKLYDVEYLISITGAANATDIIESSTTFEVGWRTIADEDIEAYSEDDILTISNDYPVIKKDQFTTLAKNANYTAVEFEDEDGMWTFRGRISGMGDSNFHYSRDVIETIANTFEDQNFEYLTFGAGVNFPTNGEMRINVADFTDDFNNMFVYLYRDGKLTRVNTTYDSGADEIVFRTNYLGSFVITDEEITNTSILNPENNNNATETPAEEPPITNNNNENPSTGASAGMNVAIVMGVVSLAAISITSRKK